MVAALSKDELPAVLSYPLFALWMATVSAYVLIVWIVLAIAETIDNERRAWLYRKRKKA